ncbi:hypothetical protein [Streptomyces akebiae]|uniref:Uncharacterized protein n=1 Tax=Streptomyces akebiae TaxID=2865673 RepID=A0ABX8XNS9_9ACTN|nr:hypothetical protein [Streptomyces akebiae]QYX77575.1 hypothetical protein K1J60_14485 [Streptomyces akebiae]
MMDATSAPFREYETGLSEQPLRQGDVLEFLQKEEFPTGWRDTIAIVVTANCDLSFGKHWGTVTYVPAIPFDVYVQQFIIPKIIATECTKSEKILHSLFTQEVATESVERALEMLQLGYPMEEISVLLPPDGKGRPRFEAELQTLGLYWTAQVTLKQCTDSDEYWRHIEGLSADLDKLRKPKTSSKELLRKEIKSRLKSFPGDTLFLCEPGPGYAGGYVVMLRLIRSIEDTSVALRPADEYHSPGQHRARRIARLKILYCHRVVQQMAQVFTDIGLPADYEGARDSHLDDYVESWGK